MNHLDRHLEDEDPIPELVGRLEQEEVSRNDINLLLICVQDAQISLFNVERCFRRLIRELEQQV
jgi:hypothetical protein